ncbi:MAG: hypothetical protein H6739_37055 [Alphaproteobacteria bacterium]|nr:hypothetical protein [Alphaproteobacteria bacterium]
MRSVQRVRPRRRHALSALVVLAVACGGDPAPGPPPSEVEQEVEAAEGLSLKQREGLVLWVTSLDVDLPSAIHAPPASTRSAVLLSVDATHLPGMSPMPRLRWDDPTPPDMDPRLSYRSLEERLAEVQRILSVPAGPTTLWSDEEVPFRRILQTLDVLEEAGHAPLNLGVRRPSPDTVEDFGAFPVSIDHDPLVLMVNLGFLEPEAWERQRRPADLRLSRDGRVTVVSGCCTAAPWETSALTVWVEPETPCSVLVRLLDLVQARTSRGAEPSVTLMLDFEPAPYPLEGLFDREGRGLLENLRVHP